MVAADEQVLRITPRRSWSPRLRELWQARELVYFLAWRDVKVRYKQTVLGVIWVLLQPLVTLAVFTFVFGRVADVGPDGVPYELFCLVGLVPWMFASSAVQHGAASVIENANVVTKVYFPRLALPTAAVAATAVDFAVMVGIVVVALVAAGEGLRVQAAAAVGFAVLAAMAAGGAALWLAALNVRYRDVRYAVPFLLQGWLFVSPVAYPTDLVGGSARVALALNPMTGVVEGFRWSLLGAGPELASVLPWSVASTAVLLLGGGAYFARTQRAFADVI